MAAKSRNSGYFGKSSNGTYTGPSGQKFDLAQVKLFYATGGKFPGQKSKSVKAGWKAASKKRATSGPHTEGVHKATSGKRL